jgi:hypothetical protein
MTDAPITLSSLATVGALAAAVFGIVFPIFRALIEYLTARFGPMSRADRAAADQNAQCRFDHSNISTLVATQNSNIATMLRHNGEMLEQLKQSNHDAQLRHQILLAKLERIDDHIRLPYPQ